MIRSFKDRDSEAVYRGEFVPRFHSIQKVALRKLDMINAAGALKDLLAPPNNRLEALKGNRKGQHSIRINDQYRICFEWLEDGPHNVEIVDYH